MQLVDTSFILLIVSVLFLLILIRYILKMKPITQVQILFALVLISVTVLCAGLIIQKFFYVSFGLDPANFEGLVYMGTCSFPVCFFFFTCAFINTKIKFTKKYFIFWIIPIINIIAAFTNNYHHLFYTKFSFNLNEMVFNVFMYIHFVYTYGLFAISVWRLLRHTTKNSGFFSKQSLLIIIGVSTPVIINLLGTFSIIKMNIYITPISFAVACSFIALAIFKFNFLSITPIALEKVVDRMSDCYLVLNEKNIVVDFNKPFLDVFKVTDKKIRNHSIYDIDKYTTHFPQLESALQSVSVSSKTVSFETYFEHINKYFHVEFSSIIDDNSFLDNAFLGTLILFKDITQHEEDLKTIKDNQDMLVERERFASLGQMIGGIAHNLKTPIMSISGAAEALNDLIVEYDASIGDPDVTLDDHHAIAKDMSSWVAKVKTHTSYMSDVITAVKGQAVSSNESIDYFTIDELINRVSILMKHELKHSLVDLNINLFIDKDFKLHGSINSLVQVIDNLVSNAIQSYNGKPDSIIDFIVEKKDNFIVFSIKDYGCGMSQEIQNKLFKEMITTKGKNGTGLGLFMSYSNIKAKFNGNITFESEFGKGTIFHIWLPVG